MPSACSSAGTSIIPIIPGTKKPGFFQHGIWVGLEAWTKRFDGRASLNRERKQWGLNGTGIGVLGGPASGDLVGIDIDTEDPPIVAALLTILPPTEVKKAGARGETWFYYGPGIASTSWSINGKRIVEILAAGRQSVLPPTVHPDTRVPYRWLGPRDIGRPQATGAAAAAGRYCGMRIDTAFSSPSATTPAAAREQQG